MTQNYEDIVREWYVSLRPMFLRKLSAKHSALSLAAAEDIYQDTFIAIQKNLMEGRLREENNWSSYIMTIGLNMASKYMRHGGRTDSFDIGIDDESDGGTSLARKVEDILKEMPEEEEPLTKNQEAQGLLGEQLTHTPEPCGSIIRLFYYEGLSMEEIASEIGYKNATTAKSKKSQCMKDLVRRVKDSLRRAGFDC